MPGGMKSCLYLTYLSTRIYKWYQKWQTIDFLVWNKSTHTHMADVMWHFLARLSHGKPMIEALNLIRTIDDRYTNKMRMIQI